MAKYFPGRRAAASQADIDKAQATSRHVAAARGVWRQIVADRPADRFRSSSLLLLEQLCEIMVAQRAALAQLQAGRPIRFGHEGLRLGILNDGLSSKLRLTVQADVVRRSRKVDEQEPKARCLLGGWRRPA